MTCTRCQTVIVKGQKYHRTQRGPHHAQCPGLLSLTDYWERQKKAEQAYTDAKMALAKLLSDFQDTCPHPLKFHRHHPDPAGGNDSWDQCTLCLKEM